MPARRGTRASRSIAKAEAAAKAEGEAVMMEQDAANDDAAEVAEAVGEVVADESQPQQQQAGVESKEGGEDAAADGGESNGDDLPEFTADNGAAAYVQNVPGAPRLMISRMVLNNFKSYAGKREIGPFHKCFSSIVGPNGSGKSNVIDALLFVFGKRANKIRLKKISELIHSSTEHPGLQKCRVSIHFQEIIDDPDDEEKYTVVPDSQFCISRSATKSNQSTYYINESPVTFKDVAVKLNGKGIDLHNNRFLILQGEVEQIAMMKPKAEAPGQIGLLEYLEELIGSNRYVEAIEESFRQVEALNDQRQEKLNRVKLVEKEKEGLESSRSEAEEYLSKQMQLYKRQSDLNQVLRHQCLSQESDVHDKRAALQMKLEGEQAKLAESTEQLTAMEAEYKRTKGEFDVNMQQLADTKATFAQFERKDIKAQEDRKHEAVKQKKVQQQLKKLQASIPKLEEQIVSDEKAIPRLQEEVEQVTVVHDSESTAYDALFEKVTQKTEPIRKQLEAKQQDLIPLRTAVNDEQQAVSLLQSEIKIFTDKAQEQKNTLKRLQSALKDDKAALVEKEAGVVVMKKQLDGDQSSYDATMKELEQAQMTVQSLGSQRTSMRGQIEEAKATLSGAATKGALLAAILKACKKGVLKGVKGRLGDLGAIDEKYDVAITTACGALDNIVVETTKDAQKCVQFVRQHNLGRATFIILEKQKQWEQKMGGKKTPQGASRLFDLVQVKDDSVRPAFYFALRDTLVCDDLSQAVKLSNTVVGNMRRWRVVTLQGQVVDTSGTMAGGGQRQRRGGMASSLKSVGRQQGGEVSEKDIREMEQSLGKLEQQWEYAKRDVKALMTKEQALSRAIKQAQVGVSKLDMEIQGLHRQIEENEGQLSQLQEARKEQSDVDDQAHMKDLTQRLNVAQQALVKAKKNAEKLEAEVKSLQQDMMKAGGSKLKDQKAKVDVLASKLDDANAAITKAQVDIDTNRGKITSAKDEIVKLEVQMKECNERMVELDSELQTIEQDALTVLTQYKELEAQLATNESALRDMQKSYESMKASVTKVRSLEVELTNQLDDLDTRLQDNIAKAAHWQKKREGVDARLRQALQDVGVDLARFDADGHRLPRVDADGNPIPENDDDADDNVDGSGDMDRHERQRLREAEKNMPHTLTEDEMSAMDVDDVKYRITLVEEQLAAMNPNMAAIEEYRKKGREYAARVQQLDTITRDRDNARKVYDNLRKKRLDEFMHGFTIITMSLKEMYQMLTLGGDAELELVDTLDPFNEGIVFSVRPPKKSWKRIQNLSGGEKTLSSLALVFALHHFRPTPLYVMDEIDAALDFKNVSIVANYIKDRTKNAQFVIISLRNNMFELADRLVGIYKTHNATKSITIDPRQFCVGNQGGQADTQVLKSNDHQNNNNNNKIAGDGVDGSKKNRGKDKMITGNGGGGDKENAVIEG